MLIGHLSIFCKEIVFASYILDASPLFYVCVCLYKMNNIYIVQIFLLVSALPSYFLNAIFRLAEILIISNLSFL